MKFDCENIELSSSDSEDSISTDDKTSSSTSSCRWSSNFQENVSASRNINQYYSHEETNFKTIYKSPHSWPSPSLSQSSSSSSSSSSLLSPSSFSLVNQTTIEENFNTESLYVGNADLASLLVETNVPRETKNKLLKLLRSYTDPNTIKNLPSDFYTLVGQFPDFNIREMLPAIAPGQLPPPPGQFVYFSITDTLQKFQFQQLIDSEATCLNLDVNIDGLPLFRGSSNCFWPILGSFGKSKPVFIIALYYGPREPGNFQEFLLDFVQECKRLSTEKLLIGSQEYSFSLRCILADAPAKASILNVKHCTGYSSCTKCTTEGEHVDGRVCFPELDAPLRSDESFRSCFDEEYHIQETILVDIPNFDIVQGIPLDYQHLICLGVMRKLLLLWTSGSKIDLKFKFLAFRPCHEVNKKLLLARKFCPREFARKPRSLSTLNFWKSVEFRTFLLYVGPVVLKELLPKDIYEHFLVFHFSIRILCDSARDIDSDLCMYTKQLLKMFVSDCITLYAPRFIIHNVHNLIHISDDALKYGCLDNFSCFKFENFLQTLKHKVRGGKFPLQQVCRRLHEIMTFSVPHFSLNKTDVPIGKLFKLSSKYPLKIDGILYKQYSAYQSKTFMFQCNEGDQFCRVRKETFVQIKKFLQDQEQRNIYLYGFQLQDIGDFYDVPYSSSYVGIHRVTPDPRSKYCMWSVGDITEKFYGIPEKDNCFVLIKML